VNRNREHVSKVRHPIVLRDRSAMQQFAADGSGTEIVKKGSDSVRSLSWRETEKNRGNNVARTGTGRGQRGVGLGGLLHDSNRKEAAQVHDPCLATRARRRTCRHGSLSCIAMMSAVESGPVSSGLVPNESSLSYETQRCGSRTCRIRLAPRCVRKPRVVD
jgi:hypothetical protein